MPTVAAAFKFNAQRDIAGPPLKREANSYIGIVK